MQAGVWGSRNHEKAEHPPPLAPAFPSRKNRTDVQGHRDKRGKRVTLVYYFDSGEHLSA